MSYSSTTYGSTAYGSLVASRTTFYTTNELLAQGVHRRSCQYTGAAAFFAVLAHMENAPVDEVQRIIRVYTHNDPHETPQLQTITGGDADNSQTIIGAARFIVVDLEMLIDASQIGVEITGQEYFQ